MRSMHASYRPNVFNGCEECMMPLLVCECRTSLFDCEIVED
jgi:hypothetical protein